MSNRTTETYTALFRYIEQNTFNLEPTRIITDFEAAMRKGVNICYNQTKLNGCWFHYIRAIKKKIRQLGLQSLFQSTPEARRVYNGILCLPLLPAEQFNEGYAYIKESAKKLDFYEKVEPFFEYYESYWITQIVCIFISILKISNLLP